MERPRIVTGMAYLNLMGVLTAIWLFDKGANIGVDPIYWGSVVAPKWQWHWVAVAIGVAFVTTVGLFLGWDWTRWLALLLSVVGYCVAAPVYEVSLFPKFLFDLSVSVLVYWVLFFSPTVNRYFARPADGQRKVIIRGATSRMLLVFAGFTAHSIVMGVFHRRMPVEIGWIGVGVFFLPALILSVGSSTWPCAKSRRFCLRSPYRSRAFC